MVEIQENIRPTNSFVFDGGGMTGCGLERPDAGIDEALAMTAQSMETNNTALGEVNELPRPVDWTYRFPLEA